MLEVPGFTREVPTFMLEVPAFTREVTGRPCSK
jgi:hypothetical protein